MPPKLASFLFWTTLTAFYGGSAAGQITSDRDPRLAINAWDGAQHGTVLRLHDGCRPDNPDCTWHWIHGMIVSDRDPRLAINAWDGAQHGTVLRLHDGCRPDNPDCTWHWDKGMIVSDRDPRLAINAWDGAQHGTVLRLHDGCRPDNPDCTWQAQYASMIIRTEADYPGRGNTVIIDGFKLPPTDWYPPGWCFWGIEAELRFGAGEALGVHGAFGLGVAGPVGTVCLPPKGMTVVIGPRGGGGGTNRWLPTQKDITQFATDTLNGVWLADNERAFWFYSIVKRMDRTEGLIGEKTLVTLPPRGEIPPDGVPWGVGHTHPGLSDIEDYYNPETGESSFMSDTRLAIDNKTTLWIRLTQGEIIKIDPGPPPFVYPVSPPNKKGAKQLITKPTSADHIAYPDKRAQP